MPREGKVEQVRVDWDRRQCSGCMSCVVVCSERHTGMSSPSRARIQVIVDPLAGDLAAKWCRQCRNAACAEACLVQAIRYDQQLRAWLVDDDVCTGCGSCLEACSFGAIRLDPTTGTAVKCDLCSGATRCVEVCPTNSLRIKGREESS